MAVAGDMAFVALRGALRAVPLTVLTSLDIAVEPGDFLLVHSGLAVAVLTAAEAAELTSLTRTGAASEDS